MEKCLFKAFIWGHLCILWMVLKPPIWTHETVRFCFISSNSERTLVWQWNEFLGVAWRNMIFPLRMILSLGGHPCCLIYSMISRNMVFWHFWWLQMRQCGDIAMLYYCNFSLVQACSGVFTALFGSRYLQEAVVVARLFNWVLCDFYMEHEGWLIYAVLEWLFKVVCPLQNYCISAAFLFIMLWCELFFSFFLFFTLKILYDCVVRASRWSFYRRIWYLRIPVRGCPSHEN